MASIVLNPQKLFIILLVTLSVLFNLVLLFFHFTPNNSSTSSPAIITSSNKHHSSNRHHEQQQHPKTNNHLEDEEEYDDYNYENKFLTQHDKEEYHLNKLHFSQQHQPHHYDNKKNATTPSIPTTSFVSSQKTLREKLWRLIELKYGTNPINQQEFNKMKENFNKLQWPITIYIYPFPDDPNEIKDLEEYHKGKFKAPLKDIHQYIERYGEEFLHPKYNRFFPHVLVESYLYSIFGINVNGTLDKPLNNEYFKIVKDIKDATIAYIPFRMNGYYFYYHTNTVKQPFDAIRRNEMFRNIWEYLLVRNNYELYKNVYELNIPHFASFSYACYRCSFHMIPPKIKLLSYEVVGVTGQPLDAWYENGCYDRCLIIPYMTYYDWPTASKSNQDYSLFPQPYNEQSFMKMYNEQWKKRKYFLTFVGGADRTLTLVNHRSKFLNSFKKKYSSKGFHWYRESWASSFNIDVMRMSKFCIQLHGDTPTRSGFYESLISGCIPLTVEKSFLIYRALFGYTVPIEDMSVVIPNKYYLHADIEDVWEELHRIEREGEALNKLKAIANYYDMFRQNNNAQKIDALSYAMGLIATQMPLTPQLSLFTNDSNYYQSFTNNERPFYFLDSPISKVYKFKKYKPQLSNFKSKWHTDNAFSSIGNLISSGRPKIYIYGNEKILTDGFYTSLIETNEELQLEKLNRILLFERKIVERANEGIGMQLTHNIKDANLIYIPLFTMCSLKRCTNFLTNEFSMKSQVQKYFNYFKDKFLQINDILNEEGLHTSIFTFFNIPEFDFTIKAASIFTELNDLMKKYDNLIILSDNLYNLNTKHDIISIPFLEPSESPRPEEFKEDKYYIQERTNMTCYFGDLRLYPVSVLTFIPDINMKSSVVFTFKDTYTQQDIENCIYTIIPYGSPNDLFTKTILAGSIPVVFPNNEQLYSQIYRGLFEFDKFSIIVPQKIMDIDEHVSAFEFSIEFFRFLQNRPFDEILARRKYIYKIRSYFSLTSSIDSLDIFTRMIYGGKKFWNE
ncbi:hypothetical protein ABK040_010842 [Willaertia magna]